VSDREDIERLLAVEEAKRPKAEAKPSAFSRAWDRLDAVVEPLVRAGMWAAPPVFRAGRGAWTWAAFVRGQDGRRTRFSPRRLAFTAAKIVLLAAVVPPFMGAFYYYATWTTYRDVYVPSSGVFQSQNFVRPSAPGEIVAPRDEIYTVLGKEIDPAGEMVPVRFDLDVNWYFFFFRDALRPDLAASKMDSQSPYGVKCDFEATGIYTRLPRYWRLWFVKWIDLRAEIVDVIKCEEVAAMPAAFGRR
jgi:hypothetical protein